MFGSLHKNNLGEGGARHLADALMVNSSLTVLAYVAFKPQPTLMKRRRILAHHVFRALTCATSLGSNGLAETGARHIADALKVSANTSLMWLQYVPP